VLAARLGHHVLSRLSEPSFIASMHEVSQHLHTRLSALHTLFPHILESHVRGCGLILGLPFKSTEDPAKLVKLARERGVLLLTAGSDAVRIVPSLNVTREEVDLAVDVIESSLGLL
jgi:acetylornithine aminotransferase